jgi:carbamoyl-phosphate synthase small subunit
VRGWLVLEDGSVFAGRSFGAEGSAGGEVVFHTAMTGYQEILTDPSYDGQIVVMTYPMIGNYGVNPEDVESRKIFASGFVVREYVAHASNWRSSAPLGAYLREAGIVGIEGIDTRAVTRKLRAQGSLRGVVGTEATGLERLKVSLATVPSMAGLDLATKVAFPDRRAWEETSAREKRRGDRPVVVIDCGAKYNILRRLADEGARVTVVPPSLSAEDVLSLRPEGILLSNGPGDPDAVRGLPDTVRKLIGRVPIFGICLGHQILGLAVGAKTYKLKFGHHGANHPVRDERTGKIEITSQNHGFAVDGESLAKLDGQGFGRVRVTHVHLTDGTIEGFDLPDVSVRAIQYHPEASPGPHDSAYLFQEFLACLKSS